MTPRIEVPMAIVEELCRRWRITELAIFGSILRDDFRPDSDVDVLVTFAPETTWSGYELVDLVGELKALFGREVELVEKPAIRNPFRRYEILRTAQVLYAA